MAKHTRGRVKTFSIGFQGDAAYDETRFARMAAEQFGTEHTEFVVEPSSADLVEKLVLVSAAIRGRAPGTLDVYQWDGVLPDEAGIQACIGEAVTGVLSLENLLIVCKHFGVLPDDVTIVEIEPQNEDYGLEFSPVAAAKKGEAIEIVRNEVMKAKRG